jgi:hypothetical protein
LGQILAAASAASQRRDGGLQQRTHVVGLPR